MTMWAVDILHESMRRSGTPKDRDDLARALVAAVEEAGKRIFDGAAKERSRRGMGTTATVAALVRGSKLRLIGVTTPTRLVQFSEVPTVSESGLSGFEFNSWFTIMAPAGTPKDIIARINAEIVKALGEPEVREKLAQQGLTIRGSSAQELGVATQEQLAKYARLIRQANITLD